MTSISSHLRAHHGVISRSEASAFGLTDNQINYRTRQGKWVRIQPNVYRLSGAPPTWLGDARAIALSSNGLVSHRAAARLWAIDGFDREGLEVTVERGAPERSWVRRLHTTTQMHLAEPTVRRGVPVTGLTRTILDVAAVVSMTRLHTTVDAVLRNHQTTWQELYSVLTIHSRRGRNGCGPLRALLEERYGEVVVPDSAWNRMVGRLLTAGGLGEPVYEHPVADRSGKFIARVDLAYPEHRVAVECDSVRFHLNAASFRSDRIRVNRLQNLGWTVLSFTWKDYADTPSELTRTVAAALRNAKLSRSA